MTEEQAKALRAPFPAAAIGKLPKPTKKDNPKGSCSECGGWHGLPAVHLDYVGHAATTDRLLQVDPEWTWEPMSHGPSGEPLFTNGGLWIWLTVAGVRRPGFGDGASPKEIIGDAIRNAAMRFGVALDLWAKEDLHAGEPDAENGAAAGGEPKPISKPQMSIIGALITKLEKAELITVEAVKAYTDAEFGKTSRKELTSREASALVDWLKEKEAAAIAAGSLAEADVPF